MEYPEDISRLIFKARKWFSRIDTNRSNNIEREELVAEFLRIGLPDSAAVSLLKMFTENDHGLQVFSLHLDGM